MESMKAHLKRWLVYFNYAVKYVVKYVVMYASQYLVKFRSLQRGAGVANVLLMCC